MRSALGDGLDILAQRHLAQALDLQDGDVLPPLAHQRVVVRGLQVAERGERLAQLDRQGGEAVGEKSEHGGSGYERVGKAGTAMDSGEAAAAQPARISG